MSNEVERGDQQGILDRESGLAALRQNLEFQGSGEPLDDHDHSNDHVALIYESREDQLESVIPFVRDGLERGERCLYVADDNSREDILEAMQDHGIDTASALDSGALSVLTPGDTYRRHGKFDRTAMLEFWEESLEEAKEDESYTGIRAAAEMTWALEGEISTDDLVEYEAVLNPLYDDEDYVVMCQYNRERFPAAVIRDVIKTHPHVVSDGIVSQNFYYTPPEKFFKPEKAESQVDRMLRTLQGRTEVRTELEEQQEYLKRVFESSYDAILVVDTQADEIVDANPAATEMLGYSRDELLALGPSDLHPDELEEFRAFVEGVFEDGAGWTDELTCSSKERGQIPVEISASRMEYGGRPVLLAVVRDVTERRRWERAQRRLYEITSDPDRSFEEKLQSIFELGCEHFDLDFGGIARVDPEADLFEVERISGEHDHLVPGEPYPLSETYCELVTEDGETAGVTDPITRGFEGKLCYDRFGVRAYLGTYLELDDRDRTFFFLSNQPRDAGFSEAEQTFLHLMGQWVKYELDRRRRVQELSERKEYLSALIETAPECIKTVAADGTLLQMNPAGLDMVEADSESDVIGESVYGLIAPEHRDTFREFNEQICQGEHGTLEFDIIGLEGMRRHMETHAAPLERPDGTISQVALTRDVTEQVERERELERAFDLLERAEHIADVGGWEIDPETMDVFWTDQIFELLEIDAEEEPPLEGALDMYHEEDQPVIEAAIADALDSGESFDIQARIYTADSEMRWIRVQGVPEIEGGEVVSLRGAVQNITDRKQREQELEEVIAKLETSNERLEQFAHAASHDLQEPLRMVSSYLQLIESRYADELDDDGQDFIEFAVDGADRMRNMIEGLLQYSRVDTQGQPFEAVALEDILADVREDLQMKIGETDAEITVDPLPTVEGDSEQLRQLFQNLLDNAIEYAGDEPPKVHVAAEEAGDEWVISIIDEGIGIDLADSDRVFDVFQSLHPPDEHDGTGIGLALCERIVERHGGDIWVDSEPGEGATFSFRLPAAETADR